MTKIHFLLGVHTIWGPWHRNRSNCYSAVHGRKNGGPFCCGSPWNTPIPGRMEKVSLLLSCAMLSRMKSPCSPDWYQASRFLCQDRFPSLGKGGKGTYPPILPAAGTGTPRRTENLCVYPALSSPLAMPLCFISALDDTMIFPQKIRRRTFLRRIFNLMRICCFQRLSEYSGPPWHLPF